MARNDPAMDPAEGSRQTIESDLTGRRSNGGATKREASDLRMSDGMGDGGGADAIRSAATEFARQAPDRFQEAVGTLGTTADRLRGEDEETLVAAYAAGLGLTLGLLFAGSNRLFVLLALAPTAYLGAALFGRLRGRNAFGGYGDTTG